MTYDHTSNIILDRGLGEDWEVKKLFHLWPDNYIYKSLEWNPQKQ